MRARQVLLRCSRGEAGASASRPHALRRACEATLASPTSLRIYLRNEIAVKASVLTDSDCVMVPRPFSPPVFSCHPSAHDEKSSQRQFSALRVCFVSLLSPLPLLGVPFCFCFCFCSGGGLSASIASGSTPASFHPCSVLNHFSSVARDEPTSHGWACVSCLRSEHSGSEGGRAGPASSRQNANLLRLCVGADSTRTDLAKARAGRPGL